MSCSSSYILVFDLGTTRLFPFFSFLFVVTGKRAKSEERKKKIITRHVACLASRLLILLIAHSALVLRPMQCTHWIVWVSVVFCLEVVHLRCSSEQLEAWGVGSHHRFNPHSFGTSQDIVSRCPRDDDVIPLHASLEFMSGVKRN